MILINKLTWVVATLCGAGDKGLSLDELNQRWTQQDFTFGKPIPRQTFDRWKGNILDLFGVIIDCDRKNGYRYYISNPQELDEGGLNRWLLNSYSTANTLSQYRTIKNRILTDEVPSSHDYLTLLMQAMSVNKVVNLTYHSFHNEQGYTTAVEPYCVKLFSRRWYLLAHRVDTQQMRIYSLDRVEGLTLTDSLFEMPKDFSAKEYFANYFGIVLLDEEPVQRIILRAREGHQHYMRTLPLHHSQKELCDKGDYVDFELTLRPTYDLCMELLRAGARIEVLEPQTLRHTMHTWTKRLWEMYKND